MQEASQNQLFEHATFDLIDFSFIKQMSDGFIQCSQQTTHQKKKLPTQEAHTLFDHPKKEINHSLGCAIYHLDPMNYSLWRKAGSQLQEIGSLVIKLKIYLSQLSLVDFVHRYSPYLLQLPCCLGSSPFHPITFCLLENKCS